MKNQQEIALGLETVFRHRDSFIVVGLTGRTGSGCSTLAKIIESESFDAISLPEIPNPPTKNDHRKDRIVRSWLKENWSPFTKIQVSQVILLLALAEHEIGFSQFVENVAPNIKAQDVDAVTSSYVSKCQAAVETLRDIKDAGVSAVEDACALIFSELPNLADALKEVLNPAHGEKSYTSIFQKMGDNVRRSGNPLSEKINPSALHVLPQTISRLIKLFRLRHRNEPSKNYFVIDALRHPFEIRYLRERIAPFYTVAVTTDDFDRQTRLLVNENYRKEEVEKLDDKEYPSEIQDPKKRPDGYEAFVSQDIQACLALADIYIRNPGKPESPDLLSASQQLCRYIALMQHPGLVTPTAVERCMHTAFSAKINSGCISRQVGAVVTDANYSIKAVGWNDVPKGQVPCLLRNTNHAISKVVDAKAYSSFEQKDPFLKELKKKSPLPYDKVCVNGRNHTYCFKSVYNSMKNDKNQVHTRALHAEENAFLQIARYGGQGVLGGFLFTTASPCELCAKKAYQLGIQKIYYIDPYPGISNEHILTAGDHPPSVELFSGAVGRAYHVLYEPIIAPKEELERLVL